MSLFQTFTVILIVLSILFVVAMQWPKRNDRLAQKLVTFEANSALMAAEDSTPKHYGKVKTVKTPGSADTINLLGNIDKDIDKDRGEVL